LSTFLTAVAVLGIAFILFWFKILMKNSINKVIKFSKTCVSENLLG
jgi:hypothetical protein